MKHDRILIVGAGLAGLAAHISHQRLLNHRGRLLAEMTGLPERDYRTASPCPEGVSI